MRFLPLLVDPGISRFCRAYPWNVSRSMRLRCRKKGNAVSSFVPKRDGSHGSRGPGEKGRNFSEEAPLDVERCSPGVSAVASSLSLPFSLSLSLAMHALGPFLATLFLSFRSLGLLLHLPLFLSLMKPVHVPASSLLLRVTHIRTFSPRTPLPFAAFPFLPPGTAAAGSGGRIREEGIKDSSVPREPRDTGVQVAGFTRFPPSRSRDPSCEGKTRACPSFPRARVRFNCQTKEILPRLLGGACTTIHRTPRFALFSRRRSPLASF